MNLLLLTLAGPAGIGLVLAVAIAWDRLREPHRDPTRPFAVVDRRTYQDAQRRIERLLATDDPTRARFLMHAICAWRRREIRTGRPARRIRRARQLEQWELRLATTGDLR